MFAVDPRNNALVKRKMVHGNNLRVIRNVLFWKILSTKLSVYLIITDTVSSTNITVWEHESIHIGRCTLRKKQLWR